MSYETRITQITVAPAGQPIFAELATIIEIEDEAAGEFVIVKQPGRDDPGKISISQEDWPVLRDAIDRMIGECRENKDGP